jgi:inner membrane protein
MPSSVVHVAFGALVAAALLRVFDARSLAAVCAFAALPDVDTFLGLWVPGGHRALLHTALLPLLLGAVVAWDARREDSWLRSRFGERGPHVAGAGVAALAVGGIAPDLMTNGVNLLYPVHDTFYAFDGELQLSNQRGVVQTFVELGGEEADSVVGTTEDVHYRTGVDVARGEDPENAERLFPVVSSGMQLVVVAAAAVAVVGRFREGNR